MFYPAYVCSTRSNVALFLIKGTGVSWSTTGIRVAGTGSSGSTNNHLNEPSCIYIDVNDTMYICDSKNNRIQRWFQNATIGSTVAGSAASLDTPMGITFDKNGNLYVADTKRNRVQRFPPGSTGASTGFIIGSSQLSEPYGVAVDDNLNVYVTDSGNKRVMRYASGATSGTAVISSSSDVQAPYGIILRNSSSNQIYLGDRSEKHVQLWTAGASSANRTVGDGINEPKGLALDPYGNLFIAGDQDRKIWRNCAGTTTHTTVINGASTSPQLDKMMGVAFDSKLNLYVTSWNPAGVYKFVRL